MRRLTGGAPKKTSPRRGLPNNQRRKTMKKLLLSLCLALILAAPAMAAIDSSEVQSHIGEQQTVCGTVA